ncbi:MAG: ATP-dependent helicase [Halomonas sp.]|nr:ATP-dependent helicase [Halomonas sp.]
MKLTAEQQAVIHHAEGHARVAAVAGAGKTTTMAARVHHLLARGVPPKRILVLMFNRSAREDFQRRLASMAPPGQALPDVRTFHSLGHRLTQSLCRWGVLAPRQLLSAEWQLERLLRQASLNVLSDAVERRDTALEGDRLETLAHFCGLVKAEMLAPETLFERLNYDPDTDYFPAAFNEAERLLRSEGVMTYADLLYRPLQALEADSALRSRVEGFLDHVIIDEYQDINAAQQRLLAVLAGKRASVMAVGDANQCIYEWRGARPDTMLENFTTTFGEATDYPLSTTFRHGHALALAANHAIAANQRRPDQLCLAATDNPDTRLSVGQGGRQLLDALIVLQDPEQLTLLLAQPTPFVARERLQRLARQLASRQAWPENHDPMISDLKPIQRRTLKKRWALLCELPQLSAWPPAKLLQHVVDTIEAEKTLKRAAARRDKGEEDVRLLDVLIEQAQSVSDPDAFIELLERPVENQAAGVLISTVHGAKGLEWPFVAVAGVNEEDFPYYSRDNPLTDDRLEEERRLFYVAITRSKEQLLVLHDGGAHRPSRFITESAWQDSMQVAACLAKDNTQSLTVTSPSLVGRYLSQLGRDDIELAAPEVQAPQSAYTASAFYPGQRLHHAVFGEGEVATVEGNPSDPVIDVRFDQAGRRRLIASRAPIERLA